MLSCLPCQSKISLWLINSLRSFDAVGKVKSNLEIFGKMGKVCSKVVLFLIIRNSRDSVQIINESCIDCKVHS